MDEKGIYTQEKLVEAIRKGFKDDLRGADLSYADLSKVDLSYADLSHTNLTKANLTKANLTNANLSVADLTGANLIKTILIKPNRANATTTNIKIKEDDKYRLYNEEDGFYWMVYNILKSANKISIRRST